jgi:hypothetical protein
MSATKLVLFIMVCFCVCADAQTPAETLAIYSRNASRLDSLTQHSLYQELTRLMSPAGIQLSWRNESDKAREEMGRLVVGTFDGDCSVGSLPSLSSWPRGMTLAESAISDGRILPYFKVDCSRVIRVLAPRLRALSVPSRETLLGQALARVIAHEIYHILAQTSDHDSRGLSKAQFSLKDLTADQFELSPASLLRIRMASRQRQPLPIAGLVLPAAATR